jgi:hypothetical protein
MVVLPLGIGLWSEGRSGWGDLHILWDIIILFGLGITLEGIRRLVVKHFGQPGRIGGRGRVFVLVLALIALAAGGNVLRLWYTTPSLAHPHKILGIGILAIIVGLLSLWYGVRRGKNADTGISGEPTKVVDAINTFT